MSKTKKRSLSIAISITVIAVIPLLLGFQNCARGFEAMSLVPETAALSDTPKNGSGTGAGTGTNSGNGNSWPTPDQQPVDTPTGADPIPDTSNPGTTNPGTGSGNGTGTTGSTISATDKAQFISLHQYSIKVSKAPAAGSYDYSTESFQGFKNQYSPSHAVTGCWIGILKNSVCAFPWSDAATVAMNYTESLIGYNVPKNFRFFVTSGSANVMMAGYAPQKSAFVFALRMGQSPSRTSAVGAAEYSNIQRNEHVDTSYARLAAGEEILVAHDGGGTVRFLSGKATTNGGWVFVRQLTVSGAVGDMQAGQNLYDLQLGVVADRASFLNHYNSINWDSSGDPQ